MTDEVLPFFVVAVHYDHKEKKKRGKDNKEEKLIVFPKVSLVN